MEGTVLYVREPGVGDGSWTANGGFEVVRVERVASAVETLAERPVGCVVVGEAVDGTAVPAAVGAVRDAAPDVPILCCSAEADGELAAAATRRGATEYVPRSSADVDLATRVRAHLDDATDGGRRAESSERSRPNGGATARQSDGAGAEATVDAPAEARSDEEPAANDAPAAIHDLPSRERYDEILEAVDDGVYALDDEGRFVYVNQALAAMTGYDRAELLGEHTRVIKDEATVERAERAVREMLAGETDETSLELELQPRTGESVPCEDHMVLLMDDGEFVGTAGVVRDVSERKARERELERYAETLEAVQDGVYVLDDEGRFAVVNQALTELTGYSESELLGEHVGTITDVRTVATVDRRIRELLAAGESETTHEFDVHPKDGEPFPGEDNMVLLRDDGEMAGIAGVIRDVSDRERRAERLSRLLDTAQSLMAAHDREAVANAVAEATAAALNHERSVVRLYEADADALVPVASGNTDPEVTDRPAYAVGEGGPGRAFAAGATQRLSELDVDPVGDVGDVEDAVYVPIGDHGVLTLSARSDETLTDADVSMAEVLGSTAAVALGRADYEAELERYRTVIENVQDMVYVVDETERFSLVTEPMADWLGYDREDLLGAHPREVLAPQEAERFEALIGDLWHADDQDGSRRLETEWVAADGERFPAAVEVSLFPTEGDYAGTVGVVRDLTDLVQARERLQTQRDRFSYLFDNLPDAVVESKHDDEGRPVVQDVNEAFTAVFGYDEEAVDGESLNDFILPDDAREEGHRLDREAAEGEVVNREVRRRTADGFRDFLFRGIPYELGDDGTHSFGIYTDITEQKERERRLEVLNRVLRHNLRNDLNVVLGYAEMLADELDDELGAKAVALHEKAADLVALSDRARSLDETMSRGTPRDSTVALAPVVTDVVERYDADHPSLDVELALSDARVVGDGRLRMAVEELLENVLEHAGPAPGVRIETERVDRELRVRVADDGPGIPADERAVVAGAAPITQLQHGSGLGLWVVKWVCNSCGGRLHIEESARGGAAVVLSLTPADE